MLAYHYLRNFNIQNTQNKLLLLSEIYQNFIKIPYENATKIITKNNNSKYLLTNPSDLFENYFKFSTGGTCFSLVYALYTLLKELNFDANIKLANRTYGENTHTLVIVNLNNNSYILDPGFLINKIIKVPEKNQQLIFNSNFNSLIIENNAENIKVSTIENNYIKFRYEIKNQPITLNDFFHAWKNSFDFKMMNNLIITKVINNKQIYIKDNRVELISKEKREKFYLNKNNIIEEINNLTNIDQKILYQALKCQNKI